MRKKLDDYNFVLKNEVLEKHDFKIGGATLDFKLFNLIETESELVDVDEQYDGYEIAFGYVFRGATSNRTIVKKSGRDAAMLFHNEVIKHIRSDVPMDDVILAGAKRLLDNVFGMAVTRDFIMKVKLLVVGAMPFNKKIYVVTYLFLDESLFNPESMRPEYKIISIDSGEVKLSRILDKFNLDSFVKAEGEENE